MHQFNYSIYTLCLGLGLGFELGLGLGLYFASLAECINLIIHAYTMFRARVRG